MRIRTMAQVAACALLTTAATTSFAVLVDFEGQGHGVSLTDGYGGLDWTDNSWTLDGSLMPAGCGYDIGRVSGNNVGYSAYEVDFGFATSDGANFQSLSFWMVPAWNDGVSVHIDAYEGGFGGTLVVSQDFTASLSDGVAQYTMSAPYAGLTDAWVFTMSGGTNVHTGGSGSHLSFDDIEYSTVPEPTSMAALGLGAAALLRRRREIGRAHV